MGHDDTATGFPDDGGRWPSPPGYRVTGLLGRGGPATYYRARHLALDRNVLLRVANWGGEPGDEWLDSEAACLARLRHPHVVRLLDRVGHEGRTYLVLEDLGGITLAQRIREGLPPVRPAAGLVEDLARTVAYVHDQGFLHRDLKPSNVHLVGRSPAADAGEVLGIPLLDGFSLALDMRQQPETDEGTVCGTPPYMAPEQVCGYYNEMGPATDVYALGVVLSEVLTGAVPFGADGRTLMGVLRDVLSRPAPSPRERRPEVDAGLEKICLRCLQKSPAERYPDARALAADLRQYLARPRRRWL